MLRIIFITLLSFIMIKAWACFDLQKIELKDHMIIKGVSINHRFIFIDDNKNEIRDLGITEVTDATGKINRKESVDFSRSILSLSHDKLPKDNLVQIKFVTLGKTIRLEIDPTIEAAKSMSRDGGCGGKLSISKY